MKRLKGSLLVASPHLPDSNFFRSVVLMIEHESEGALGLILNRVTNTTLQAVWAALEDQEITNEQHLFVGGPVDGPLMSLHGNPDLEGVEVVPDVYFSSEPETIRQLIGQTTIPYRIYSGYAGWGPGQLDQELKVGGWLTSSAHRQHVFGDPDQLWQQVTHTIGAEITDRALRIRHRPADPRTN